MRALAACAVSLAAFACLAPAAGAMAAAAAASTADEPYIYAHHRVSTIVGAAQAAFDRGLTLIYAYQHEEAEQAFRQAARLDPSLALAWWGVALALGPNINTVPDPKRTVQAATAINRARLLAARQATPAERDYVEALARRYSKDPTPDFDALAIGYREAMRALVAHHPDDPDAAALYAEAIMDLRPWRLWSSDGQPEPGTLELVDLIERGLRAHPDHLGLMHYYIHAVEASNDPGRALAAARRLVATRVEPAAAHLVHMPAHTFLRVGDWQAAIDANEHALHHSLDYRLSKDPEAEHVCGHCLDFLAYAYTMQGNLAGARRAAEGSRAIDGNVSNLVAVLTTFHDWPALLALPEPAEAKQQGGPDPHVVRAYWHYGRGLAELGGGAPARAADELAALRREAALAPAALALPVDRPDIAHAYDNLQPAGDAAMLELAARFLEAQLAAARGQAGKSIALLREATAFQDRAPYAEPPLWPEPLRRSLGAALSRSGAAQEAVQAFRDSLRSVPHDPRALVGLRAALAAAGRTVEAAALDTEIAAAQRAADQPLAAD